MQQINENIEIEVIQDIADKATILNQSKSSMSIKFDKDKINIVTVCRLEPPKGLDMAIEACGKIAEQTDDFHWYFIGDGTLRLKLEEQISMLKINNKVTFMGFRENPYPYMVAADIYAQTSKFEGLGLTLIEAVILQKPIVTTNFDTAKAIIIDGKNGLIADMNSESIASKILKLINDDKFRLSLTMHPSEKYDLDKLKSLVQVYNLLDER